MIESTCLHLCRAVTGVQSRWQCELPTDAQRVYFANHTSNLDLPVIWASLPDELRKNTRPVAAADYWKKTKARSYFATKIFRALLIERKGAGRLGAFKDMLQVLDEGSSLIIFPEGTRTPGHNISDFKSGLYVLARERRDILFIPTYLENLNRILPKGEKLLVPLICSVTFGSPLTLIENEEKGDFLRRAKQSLEELAK